MLIASNIATVQLVHNITSVDSYGCQGIQAQLQD